MDDPKALEVLEQREVWRGRMLAVNVDSVKLPNGNAAQLEIVKHPGAAAVVAVDEDSKVVLVRQIRYATGGWLLEVPAGKLDKNEAPKVCASRELAEETGLQAGRLVSMGSIWTSPGFTDERIWLFLATGLSKTQQALEHDEVLTVERLPMREALERALRGDIEDAKSACAILRAPRFLYG
jgi:ADP-ribose pyrophosphatase